MRGDRRHIFFSAAHGHLCTSRPPPAPFSCLPLSLFFSLPTPLSSKENYIQLCGLFLMHSRCQKKSWPGLSVLLTSDLSPHLPFWLPRPQGKKKTKKQKTCRLAPSASSFQKPKEGEEAVWWGRTGFLSVIGSVGKIQVIWEKKMVCESERFSPCTGLKTSGASGEPSWVHSRPCSLVSFFFSSPPLFFLFNYSLGPSWAVFNITFFEGQRFWHPSLCSLKET